VHGRESTLLVGRAGPALSGLRPPFPQQLARNVIPRLTISPFAKKLAEGLFEGNQLAPEDPSGSVHAVVDRRHLL